MQSCRPGFDSIVTDIMFGCRGSPTSSARRGKGRRPYASGSSRGCATPYFGEPRQAGTSHRVYRTPWPGDPRVNIQDHDGMVKRYQVRQVLRAIEKLEAQRD